MRILCISCILVFASCQIDRTDRTDRTDSARSSITEGTLAAPGEYPETVFLWLGGGSCTGTLVAGKVILTARHCLEDVSAPEVYFGNDPRADNEGGTWINGLDILLHPGTDIAMMALETRATAKPVPIHTSMGPADIDRPVTIVGFGDTQGDGPAGIKREGLTSVSEFVDDVMVVGATGADTCFGDSGGPTFVDVDGVRHVAAVTSSGDSNDCREGLSFNIRTDHYTDWITDYIRAHSCEDADGECRNDCDIPDPDCAAVGELCTSNADCAGNLCGTIDDESLCTQTCTADADCSDGFECRGDKACWPASNGGGCAAGGHSQSGTGVLIFLGLAFLARRRRRRC